MTSFTREQTEVEALRTDRYLEALLAQRDRPVAPVAPGPVSGSEPPVVDAALRSVIATLDGALVRVHPSFRFEERLSRRLAEVADSLRLSEAAGAEGARVPVALPYDPAVDPADPDVAGSSVLPTVARPLLIGALSLASAAIVAWRLGRPGDPMTRAVRAASVLRAAARVPGVPHLPDAVHVPGARLD